MKKLIPFLFLIISQFGYSQPNGNEWIDYSQNYYSFKISENGIYRISYQDLIAANIPLATINPKTLQIFARGNEIPIYLKGENDGVFDATDFIEFYGQKNDGWIDSVFYKGRANQPNPHYSILSDTINYYLTWNNKTNNKRIQEENAVDFGNYFPASYIWKENIYTYNNQYYDGQTILSNATDPEYVPTEGWMSSATTLGKTSNYPISFKNRYNSGPYVNFEIAYAGQSDWAQRNDGDHHINIEVGGNQIDDIFEGYKLRKMSTSFSPTEVVSGDFIVKYKSVNDRNVAVDRSAVAYIKYSYPHTLVLNNANEFYFQLDDQTNQSASYIDLINFNGGNAPILYDLSNGKRIKVIETLTTYRALVPNANGRKKCLITAESNVKSVQLKSIGNNHQFIDYQAYNLDSAFLIVTHNSLYSEATRYATYRASKGYNPIILDIEQLYHQYGFGISKNPLAIRNFISTTFKTANPSYLFLLGKSVNQKDARKNPLINAENLVPSFGNPTVDNLLTSGLNGTRLESAIPTGRLSAKYLIEVRNYLDKVIQYESAPPALWMKKALHFAGGLSLPESNRYENYLGNYSNYFVSDPMGGKTFLFKKSTSVPIQTTLSDSIRTLINSGVSLMTFFGHASTTGGFDISIDSPEKLNNKGKYPTILANSCFSGNYHQSGVLSVAEQYVLEKNKGAIAFIASGNLGYPSTLNLYSNAFYRNVANDNYGRSMAENMVQTVKDIQGTNPYASLRLVCMEMTMQGDPALKLNSQALPDYMLDQTSVKVLPDDVTTDLDSFQIKVNCYNLGKSVPNEVLVQLTRQFPNNQAPDTNYLKVIPYIGFNGLLTFNIPIAALNSTGLNSFSLIIDPNNAIPELNELNNRLDFDVLIRSGEIIPVYPYNYSIVGQQGITLKASTAFALEKEYSYVFELDTSAAFNSLLKPTTTISSSGGLVEWAPSLLNNMPDSMVYFWRVSKVPKAGEAHNWRTSSFQYIANESGWAQDHFDQFSENKYSFISQNHSSKKFDFVDNVKELYVFNAGSPSTSQNFEIRYSIDADVRERNACGPGAAFLIAVLDSLTLESWETPYGNENLQNDFGQDNKFNYCGTNRTRSEKFFLFRANDSIQMQRMKEFLTQVIPDGSYIVAYSWQNINYSTIRNRDSTVLKAFESLGSNLIPGLNDHIPFIFTCKKGKINSAQEIVGATTTSEIELRKVLTISADFGEITSIEIGPSTNFSRLAYAFKSLEANSDDEIEVTLNAIEQNGALKYLMQFYDYKVDTSIANVVNNNNYRGLQLDFKGKDQTHQTPPQLERWQVSFDEFPDFALAPNLHFKLNNESLNEGDNLELEIGIKNSSEIDGDSLLVQFQIINSLNQVITLPYKRQAPLKADSLLISKIAIPTRNLTGNNKLIITVNPNQDQAEQHSFNNIGQLDFKVIEDRLNPLIDVTFDGRHILNREIVSAQPEIVIQLKDENQYLALDDTSVFSVFLRYPNRKEELMNFGSAAGTMEFIPASLPNNTALARLKPNLTEDGVYAIRIQAYDKSGNASGGEDYLVEFEVVTKSSITNMVNYPNPFSTSTRFVFTLTGSEIPEQIQIQILTVTGKVVKEIDQYELGPIHIGNNISQYAWDGKDEYGDQLANGVYLYRVRAKLNGNNLEKRDSKLDQFFVKDFGKMYLLR